MTTTMTGTIVFRDLEMGTWVFESDSGETYLLAGGDRKIKKNGARIEVSGAVDMDSVSFQMVGQKLTVSRYRFL